MSTNRQSYFPQIDQNIDPKMTVHLQRIYPALNDHDQAISLLKTQLESVIAGTTTIKTVTTNTSTTSTTGVTSFNGSTGAITFFPNLGTRDDQTGQVTYVLQQLDNGALLILNDAAPVAVDLNAAITTPFFCFIVNWGAGTATLTPESPSLINYYANVGATSMPILTGSMAVLEFDGLNWNAATVQVPVTFGAVTHQWLKSYDSTTGLFTATQPAFTDISGIVAPAQLPTPTAGTLGGVESAGPIANEWINQIDTSGVPHLSQPSFTNLSGKLQAGQLLTNTSGSLGGSAMTAGQTITIAVTVTGATVGMVAVTSPETYPGDGFVWDAYVSAADTVTVRLTATLAGTPTASVYDVRLLP